MTEPSGSDALVDLAGDELPDDVGHPVGHVVREFGLPHAPRFAVGLLALVLARIPQRVPALLFGVALDALLIGGVAYDLPLVPAGWIPTTQWGQLWFTAGLLAGAVVAESALDWFATYAYDRATLRTLHDVRVAASAAALDLSMAHYDAAETGDVMSVLNNDVNNVEKLAEGVYDGVRTTASVLVPFGFLLWLNWQLALVAALFPVAIGATSRSYANLLEPWYERVRESVGQVNGRLEGAVSGIEAVKAFAREPAERERVASASRDYRSTKWGAIRLRTGYDATTWLVSGSGDRLVFLLGGYWVLAGPPWFFTEPLTAGALLTFVMYQRSFLFPIRRLAVDVIDRYEDARASCQRVLALLASPARRSGGDEDLPAIDVTDGAVEYDDVTFTYEGADEPAVADVDLDVEPGEFVGVVGATGAGKSTLVKLCFRFYDPDSGTIRVDGTDTREVDARSLRRQIGYVSQDPFLFHGTVRENVAYADPDPEHDAVVEAATAAGAHEFVTDLPAGYDSQVGERGVQLSGGQRQRIALARVLYRDPPILVLDEATSHVDNETELQIQRSLEALTGDRTTFAIAHRLSTVRDADRIVVLDDGRVVETGTHGELLERDGAYADLWRVQVGDLDAVSEEFLERARRREEVVE